MRWTQGAAGRPFLSTDGVRKRALTFYQQLPDECASARTGLLDGPVGFVSSCHARDIPTPVKVCGGERVPELQPGAACSFYITKIGNVGLSGSLRSIISASGNAQFIGVPFPCSGLITSTGVNGFPIRRHVTVTSENTEIVW